LRGSARLTHELGPQVCMSRAWDARSLGAQCQQPKKFRRWTFS
jgi:hypothetical protein